MAEIVWCRYIFHLAWPMSLHYLVKSDVLNFYLTLDLLQSACSDLVSEWRGHTVATSFLLRGHCQTCAGCLETIFYVSAGRDLGASSMRHCRFPGARERCEKRVVIYSACVRIRRAHFEHEFWQFWAHLSRQLVILLNKPYSVFGVLIQSSDTLL